MWLWPPLPKLPRAEEFKVVDYQSEENTDGFAIMQRMHSVVSVWRAALVTCK